MRTLTVLILAFSLFGCGNAFLTPDDALRQRVLELETENAALIQRRDGLEKRLAIQDGQNGTSLPAGTERPICVRIELDPYTGPIDRDHDGKLDGIRLYVVPRDAKSRFIQTLGTLHCTATAIPAGDEPITVGKHTFDIAAFDAAFRAGLTGNHYTLEIPIDAKKIPTDLGQVTVKIQLKDAITGAAHEAERTVKWPSISPAP